MPPDRDGNGIADIVDTGGPNSNDFSDGKTRGVVVDKGDQVLIVTDAADERDGVLIIADVTSRGRKPATVTVCEGAAVITLDAGDVIIVTCGSVTIEVLAGSVEVMFVAEDGTEAVASIGRGNELTFDAVAVTFDAPATNADTIVIMVGDEQISVASGQHADVEAMIAASAPVLTPAPVIGEPTPEAGDVGAGEEEDSGGPTISAILIALIAAAGIIGGLSYTFLRRSNR